VERGGETKAKEDIRGHNVRNGIKKGGFRNYRKRRFGKGHSLVKAKKGVRKPGDRKKHTGEINGQKGGLGLRCG